MILDHTHKVKKFYERFGEDFLKLEYLPEEVLDYLKAEEEYLLSKIREGSKVVDFGCGRGRILKLLLNRAELLVGVDHSRKMLNYCEELFKKHKHVRCHLSDVRSTPLRDDIFDYTLCMYATFGSFHEPEKVLKEMIRVTKPGGKIILSVYSEDALDTVLKMYESKGIRVERIEGNVIYTKEGDVARLFSKEEIRKLLARHNLNPRVRRLCPIAYICEAEVLK